MGEQPASPEYVEATQLTLGVVPEAVAGLIRVSVSVSCFLRCLPELAKAMQSKQHLLVAETEQQHYGVVLVGFDKNLGRLFVR